MDSDSLYSYRAKIVKVIDGDTCILNIDLGFRVFVELSCRLAHIDTPELHSPDDVLRARASKAKQKLIELTVNPAIIIKSFKPFKSDKYGRFLVEIINSDGVNVNQLLLDSGFAVPYEGGKK